MADKLLDLEGLTYYDQKIKDYIDTADEKVTSDLTDKLDAETQARTQADTKLQTKLGNRIDDVVDGTTPVGKLTNPLQFGVEGSLDNYDGSVAGKKITKAVLGLGNVDNTADINKPVSTAQQFAIDNAKSELLGDAGTNYNTLGKLEDAIQAEVTRAGQAEDDIDADLQEFKTSTNQNITQIEQNLASEGERITALDNNVVKKTGQSSQAIQGNIQIQGDLTVNGTTTSEDHQTLLVQDNIIVTNSDGVAISGLSGIAIRINATSAFGIVYDPSVQELKAGLGTLSEENEFTFSSGEGYPITLRDSDGDLVDGNVVMWDNVGKRLTDSGIVANLIALQNGTYAGMTVGNATNAVNATNDGSGQNIANTYATKAENNAKYTKPDGGIPKSDLSSDVQTSLGKADTALQSVPLATSSAVGGVKPTSKTTQMTQAVGVDSNGALWTAPANGGIEQNEVIAVKSLPAATADSPDFVQTLDGKLYRKKSSQTNGIDTTKLQGIWKLKTTSNVSGLTNFNTDMTASASAVAHAFDEDLFGFIFSGQTFNTFNYYIEEFTLYESGTWQIKDDIEFYAAADNLSYKTELLAMMNQCYTKQTSSIITTYSYEEVGGTEVVANPTATGTQDLTSLQVGGTVYNIPQGSGGITKAEVIEYADELPTASETSPNFIQTPDGTLYRKKAVESGGLLGTWVFNDTITLPSNKVFHVKFSCDGVAYIWMGTQFTGVLNYFSADNIESMAYRKTNGWMDQKYKTIQITDVSSLTNIDEFTSFITANATKQDGGGSVSYEYVAMQEVPTPTTADNGKVLGVTNGAYALQELTNEIVDVGTLLLDQSVQISSDLYSKIQNTNNYVFKFTFEGSTQYAFRSTITNGGAYPTYYFIRYNSFNILEVYNIFLNGGGYYLKVTKLQNTEFATVDECANAFNPTTIQLISFTTTYHSLQAEEGMTWGEWINSSYNDGAFYASGEFVIERRSVGSATEGSVQLQDRTYVKITDTIIANYAYLNSSSGGTASTD